eukprot:2861500-Pleurochrysis_carterae.AAC.1
MDSIRLHRPTLRRLHARSLRSDALGRPPPHHVHATFIARVRFSQLAHAYSITDNTMQPVRQETVWHYLQQTGISTSAFAAE